MALGTIVSLIIRTAREFLDDDCTHLAAGVAYYALFSIFPLLLGLIALFGVVLEPARVQEQLLQTVDTYLPGSTNLVSRNVEAVVETRGTIGVLAIVGFFWSASALFGAIRRSLNRAWHVEKERPLLKQKLLELSMIGGTGLLFVLSLASTAAFQVLEEIGLVALSLEPLLLGTFLWDIVQLLPAAASLLVEIVGIVLPFTFTFGIFALLYRLVPNTRVRWGEVWPGALLGAFLFEVAKNVFVWYVDAQANYSLVYGPLATVMAFLLWAYISALILLLGAELSSEYGRLRYPRRTGQPADLRAGGQIRLADCHPATAGAQPPPPDHPG